MEKLRESFYCTGGDPFLLKAQQKRAFAQARPWRSIAKDGGPRPGSLHSRGGGVKYRMLHIPGISDCTYHLHISMSVCSRF